MAAMPRTTLQQQQHSILTGGSSRRAAGAARPAAARRRPTGSPALVVRAAKDIRPLQQAAEYVVDTYVRDQQVVGVGTGRMASAAIEYLGKKLGEGSLRGVRVVPTSDAAASEAAFHGVPQVSLDDCEQVHVAFDEADEVDCSDGSLPFIMGRSTEPQQPQLVRARAVAKRASAFIIMLDDIGNVKERLGGELAVVMHAQGWEDTAEELDDIFLGDAELWRRPSQTSSLIGPRGGDSPYVSSEGYNIVDVRFYGGMKLDGDAEAPYSRVLEEIERVAGVVGHGLFLDVADAAVVAMAEGEPLVIDKGEKITAGARKQQLE